MPHNQTRTTQSKTTQSKGTQSEIAISFCILSGGRRPAQLLRTIASIEALAIPRFEIIVGGVAPESGAQDQSRYRSISLIKEATEGKVSSIRNRLIEAATYDTLVLADDDVEFLEDFYQGLRRYGTFFDLLCVRFINPDGTRCWDWATYGGPRGHCLLDYDEKDEFQYATSGILVIKKEVGLAVRFDEALGFNQMEDVDFSRRVRAAGYSIDFCGYASVLHNDRRYTQLDDFTARLYDPTEYEIIGPGFLGRGFYALEANGSRFMGRQAHIKVASMLLILPSVVKFTLTALPNLQEESSSLTSTVRCGSHFEAKITFENGITSHDIEIALPAAEEDLVVSLESSAVFIPFFHGNPRDRRPLAVAVSALRCEPVASLLVGLPSHDATAATKERALPHGLHLLAPVFAPSPHHHLARNLIYALSAFEIPLALELWHTDIEIASTVKNHRDRPLFEKVLGTTLGSGTLLLIEDLARVSSPQFLSHAREARKRFSHAIFCGHIGEVNFNEEWRHALAQFDELWVTTQEQKERVQKFIGGDAVVELLPLSLLLNDRTEEIDLDLPIFPELSMLYSGNPLDGDAWKRVINSFLNAFPNGTSGHLLFHNTAPYYKREKALATAHEYIGSLALSEEAQEKISLVSAPLSPPLHKALTSHVDAVLIPDPYEIPPWLFAYSLAAGSMALVPRTHSTTELLPSFSRFLLDSKEGRQGIEHALQTLAEEHDEARAEWEEDLRQLLLRSQDVDLHSWLNNKLRLNQELNSSQLEATTHAPAPKNTFTATTALTTTDTVQIENVESRNQLALTIGIDIRSLHYPEIRERGIGAYTFHHIQALAKELPESKFILLSDQIQSDELPEEHAIQALLSTSQNITFSRWFEIDRTQLDVYHICDQMSLLFGYDSPLIAAPQGIPVTLTFYDLIPLGLHELFFDTWPPMLQEVYQQRLLQLKQSRAHVLAISEFTKDDLITRLTLPSDRITAILAGLPSEELVTSDSGKGDQGAQATLSRFGTSEPFFLIVGSLDKQKNFALTFEAYQQVAREHDVGLVIVGSFNDPHKQEFHERASALSLNKIRFTGFLPRNELNHLYHHALGLIFPSLYEGFGFPVLEAFAMGCPVITSSTTSLPEVAGDAAIMVDPFDKGALATAMTEILTAPHLRRKLSQKGSDRLKNFSWEDVAKRTVAVWEKLLS